MLAPIELSWKHSDCAPSLPPERQRPFSLIACERWPLATIASLNASRLGHCDPQSPAGLLMRTCSSSLCRVACLALLFALALPMTVLGQIVGASGSYTLWGAGVDDQGNSNSSSVFDLYPGGVFERTVYSNLGTGTRADGSSGPLTFNDGVHMFGDSAGSLHMTLTATDRGSGRGRPSEAAAEALLRWTDRATFTWTGIGPAPALPDSVLCIIEAEIVPFTSIYSVPTASAAEAASDVYSLVGIGSIGTILHQSVYTAQGVTYRIDDEFGFQPSLSDSFQIVNNQVSFSYQIGSDASASWGASELDAVDTVKLSRIEFADGTTPEEQGWKLTFDSGMPSPNVPEPSTIVLLGIAPLLMGGHRVIQWRRKRRTVFCARRESLAARPALLCSTGHR
jgi:hypothetical protein